MLLDSMEWKYWSNIPQLDSTIVLVWMGSWNYFTAKTQVLWLLYSSMKKVVNQVLSGSKGSLSKKSFAMYVSFDLKNTIGEDERERNHVLVLFFWNCSYSWDQWSINDLQVWYVASILNISNYVLIFPFPFSLITSYIKSPSTYSTSLKNQDLYSIENQKLHPNDIYPFFFNCSSK